MPAQPMPPRRGERRSRLRERVDALPVPAHAVSELHAIARAVLAEHTDASERGTYKPDTTEPERES